MLPPRRQESTAKTPYARQAMPTGRACWRHSARAPSSETPDEIPKSRAKRFSLLSAGGARILFPPKAQTALTHRARNRASEDDRMITGSIKSQVDAVWNAFWSGGISNPLEVIEQITYLLFLRRL